MGESFLKTVGICWNPWNGGTRWRVRTSLADESVVNPWSCPVRNTD